MRPIGRIYSCAPSHSLNLYKDTDLLLGAQVEPGAVLAAAEARLARERSARIAAGSSATSAGAFHGAGEERLSGNFASAHEALQRSPRVLVSASAALRGTARRKKPPLLSWCGRPPHTVCMITKSGCGDLCGMRCASSNLSLLGWEVQDCAGDVTLFGTVQWSHYPLRQLALLLFSPHTYAAACRAVISGCAARRRCS